MKEKFLEKTNNLRIEIFVIVIFCIIFFLKSILPNEYVHDVEFLSYFTQDRLNGIATFFSITIGIYITVITVLATSELEISKDMLAKRIDKPLIKVMVCGMVENLITVTFSIFVGLNDDTVRVFVLFLCLSVISFVKFIILLIKIFNINLEKMARAIDARERYKDDILACTEEIRRYLRENKKNK